MGSTCANLCAAGMIRSTITRRAASKMLGMEESEVCGVQIWKCWGRVGLRQDGSAGKMD